MAAENQAVRVFVGNQVEITLIQEELEKQGIFSYIRDDFSSGIMAGFVGGVPSAIDLYVEQEDLERATMIIKDLIRSDQR